MSGRITWASEEAHPLPLLPEARTFQDHLDRLTLLRQLGAKRMDRNRDAHKRLPGGLCSEGSLRPVILESWSRSRAAGVAQEPERFQLSRVADDDLQRRLAANAALLTIARPHL